ncbi:hypothetical protein [Methylocella silvestris]|uniref:hypothetical protein n=1 Tax=Methylocella silvestris TaxID=199596 RepID=UPI0011AF1E43|nr:hypothetical protein [Methylocella silvestris]
MRAETSAANNSTYVLGQPVEITVSVTGASASKAFVLTAAIRDEFGAKVATLPLSILTDRGGYGGATFNAPASRLGYFEVKVAAPDGATNGRLGTRPAGVLTYAIVPDPATRVDYGEAGARFGLQGGFSAGMGAVIPLLGVRYVQAAGGGWTAFEPNNPGQFAADRAAAVAAGRQHPPKDPLVAAVTFGGSPWSTYSVFWVTIASLPSWAVDAPTKGASTSFSALSGANLANLANFASALASAVAADYPAQANHYYQITWEPQMSWGFKGASEQLVQYYSTTYAAIKAADPKAIVAGPALFVAGKSADGSVDQMSQMWAGGLANYIDAVSMHPYATPGFPPEAHGYITDIRGQISKAAAAKGAAMPFIGTEHGYDSAQYGLLQQAQANIRQTLIVLGEGFKLDFMFYVADFWDATPSDASARYGLFYNLSDAVQFGTPRVGPKPAAAAYAAMTYLLDGSTTAGAVSGLTGSQLGYKFTRGGRTILTVWDWSASTSANLTIPVGSYTKYDWMGNGVGGTSSGTVSTLLGGNPIYFVY